MSAAGLSATTLQPATAVAALDEAVEAAQRAFELGRQADPDRRAGWLEAIAAGLEQDSAGLVGIAARETHLAVARLEGELKRTVFQLRLFAAEIRLGEHFDATIDHADPAWGMGPRPDLRVVVMMWLSEPSDSTATLAVPGIPTATALGIGAAAILGLGLVPGPLLELANNAALFLR